MNYAVLCILQQKLLSLLTLDTAQRDPLLFEAYCSVYIASPLSSFG